MRYWTYCEEGDYGQYIQETWSEAQILAAYFPSWAANMKRLGRDQHISEGYCIDDWVVISWAWETDERGMPRKERTKEQIPSGT